MHIFQPNFPVKLFLTGMVFMLLALIFFSFCLYLIPYLFLGMIYDIPEFIFSFHHWLEYRFHMRGMQTNFMVFLPFFFSFLICGWMAYLFNNKLDQKTGNIVAREKAKLADEDQEPEDGLEKLVWQRSHPVETEVHRYDVLSGPKLFLMIAGGMIGALVLLALVRYLIDVDVTG